MGKKEEERMKNTTSRCDHNCMDCCSVGTTACCDGDYNGIMRAAEFEKLAEQARYADKLRNFAFDYGAATTSLSETAKLYLTPTPRELKMMKKAKKTWTFNAPTDAMISLDKLASELSYAHPLVFTSRKNNDQHLVLMHPMMYNKAYASFGEDLGFPPVTIDRQTPTVKDYYLYFSLDSENLYALIRWVKKVKAEPFADRYKDGHERVTVTQI
jgi:hypothetical protein